MKPEDRYFVKTTEALREPSPWTRNEWLCRPDVVGADKLLLVRATMNSMHCHPFHTHPHREELIYVIGGHAEQWLGNDYRILGAGDVAHIPAGMVHATYNPHPEPLVFLAILSPAKLPDDLAAIPDPQDVSTQEPWASIRKGLPECKTLS